MVEQEQVVLQEGYYLDNFWHILRSAEALYADLFTAEEALFFEDFSALSLASQRLYVRLLSRRGHCFRRDRIAYQEVPDLDRALAELGEAHFVATVDELPLSQVLSRLLRDELVSLARAGLVGGESLLPRKGLSGMRKDSLIARLCERVDAGHADVPVAMSLFGDDISLGASVRAWIAEHVPMVQLLRWEETLSFRLFTFGSLSYDLTDFVLQELGLVVYEEYPITREHRIFPDRKAVDEALLLSQSRDAVSLLLDADVIEEAWAWTLPLLEDPRDWSPTSRRYLDRIFLRMGRTLERRGDVERALEILSATGRPPSRERRARILQRAERYDEAMALCDAMREEPRDETEAPVAERIAYAIRRSRGEEVPKRRRAQRDTVKMALVRSEDGVEADVLCALLREGQPGVHGENALWLALFGLACWDIVFADVPGAFQHPFQRGPLDLYQEDFRHRREALFAARFDELRGHHWQGRLASTFREKRGLANAFVAWDWLTEPLLNQVLEVLPGAHLAAVCDRLSRDVRRYRRGFPDLFVFVPHAPADAPQYRLIEVKGPGDQLRPEQGAWLDYFASVGIPATIAKVTWREEPVQRSLF